MSDVSNRIVQKLWSYCNVLRDDGLSYQDYLEQLTFLLFLKMADEREKLGHEVARHKEGSKWTNFGAPVITAVVGATIVTLLGALATVTVALLRATTGR